MDGRDEQAELAELAELKASYDRVADAYAAHFPGTEPEQPVELAVIDHLVGLLGSHPQVLDAGSGTGRMSRYLADRGCRVQGLDLSEGMVRAARRDHPDLPTRVGSITALPFADGAFDGVLSWFSVIHLPDDRLPLVAAEVHRVLRPGGLVLVAFQTGDEPREVGEGYRTRGFDVRMVRHHRSLDRVAGLMSAGFTEEVRFERAPVGPERDGQGVLVLRRT